MISPAGSLFHKVTWYYKRYGLSYTLSTSARRLLGPDPLLGWINCPSSEHKERSFKSIYRSLTKKHQSICDPDRFKLDLTTLSDEEIISIQKTNSFRQNLLFYRHLRLYSNLFDAWRFRKNLRSLAINQLKRKGDASVNSCLLALEAGEYDLCHWWTKQLRASKKEWNLELLFFISLFTSNYDDARVLSRRINKRSSSDTAFIQDIRDKDIAVIGPLEISDLSDLDRYDYLATPKYISESSILTESKKVITYYGGGAVDSNLCGIVNTVPLVAHACFKEEAQLAAVASKTRDCSNLRTMRSPLPILYNDYGASAIQNIIYDLLLCSPSRIKIYNSDFYAGTNVKSKLYQKGMNKPTSSSVISQGLGLRIHDPFSNYAFIRNLHKQNIIDAEQQVHSILCLTEEEYAAKLSLNYDDNDNL